jgi:hypothetical protein
MPPRTGKGRHQVPHRISAVSGRQRGSHPVERLPPGDERIQTGDLRPSSSRTNPDDAERLTGIYGPDGRGFVSPCLELV